MEPYQKKIIHPALSSFVYKQDFLEAGNDWHFHPEMEIQLNLKGRGMKFIGDSIEPFYDGDLVFLGENLPHYWREEEVSDDVQKERAHVIVIQFLRNFAGDQLWATPEFAHLPYLFERAKRGMKIFGKTAETIREQILDLPKLAPFEQVLGLLRIVNLISETTEFSYLSSIGFTEKYHLDSDKRINKIYEYTLSNFTNTIRISDVSAIACMNTSAFCRFFKARTKKNYSQFLKELRVGYACKQLVHAEKDIKEVCYSSGFESLANFNRQFKSVTKQTPSLYRKAFSRVLTSI